MKPSTLTKDQALKIGKTLLYLAISSAIGGAIAILAEQPELFGVYTPIVNVLLVTIKQVFTKSK